MNRRNLIKTMAISAVGLATVPLWVDSWTAEDLSLTGFDVDDDQRLLLAELVDAIIPATDTPGAKELEVHKFILTMLGDCYEKDIQDEFLAGFEELNATTKEQYGKTFMKMQDRERNNILSTLATAEIPPEKQVNFVSLVKSLTITGYMSSKYVLQNILQYEQVPSRFYGSFPVNQSIYSNA